MEEPLTSSGLEIGGLSEEMVLEVLSHARAFHPLLRLVCKSWSRLLPARRAKRFVADLEELLRQQRVEPEHAYSAIRWALRSGCPWTPERCKWPARLLGPRSPAAAAGACMGERGLVPIDDVIGYKSVTYAVVADVGTRVQLPSLRTVLALQIPARTASVYGVDGQEGDICPMAALQRGHKYATSVARVVGVRFFGSALSVRRALVTFQAGRGLLFSHHDPTFEYVLGEEAVEPRAGRGCGHGRCGSGIYFFTDFKSAASYSGQTSGPIVTARLSEGSALELSLRPPGADNEDDLRKEADKRALELDAWLRREAKMELDIPEPRRDPTDRAASREHTRLLVDFLPPCPLFIDQAAEAAVSGPIPGSLGQPDERGHE